MSMKEEVVANERERKVVGKGRIWREKIAG